MIYNITIENTMGNLIVKYDGDMFKWPPNHIRDFIKSKIDLYINTAVDTSNLGCRFYILKAGLKPKWTYYINDDQVIITYKLDEYDYRDMIYVSNKEIWS